MFSRDGDVVSRRGRSGRNSGSRCPVVRAGARRRRLMDSAHDADVDAQSKCFRRHEQHVLHLRRLISEQVRATFLVVRRTPAASQQQKVDPDVAQR